MRLGLPTIVAGVPARILNGGHTMSVGTMAPEVTWTKSVVGKIEQGDLCW